MVGGVVLRVADAVRGICPFVARNTRRLATFASYEAAASTAADLDDRLQQRVFRGDAAGERVQSSRSAAGSGVR